jgi:hypothetical protein
MVLAIVTAYLFVGVITVRFHYAIARRFPKWSFLKWVNVGYPESFPNELYFSLWAYYWFQLAAWIVVASFSYFIRISGVSTLKYHQTPKDTLEK